MSNASRQKTFKLISLNVGIHTLSQKQLRFLGEERPDVICLQEFPGKHFKIWKETLGMEGLYTSTFVNDINDTGLVFLSRLSLSKTYIKEYALPKISRKTHGEVENSRSLLQIAYIKFGNQDICIANIHFTWSPCGLPTQEQRKDAKNLKKVLQKFNNVLLCGDLNAPRGGEIFLTIASGYQDHIPLRYKTSIDGKFHRSGALPYMVDAILSSSNYESYSVRLVPGLSDHRAVVAHMIVKD